MSATSKIFERLMYKEVASYMEKYLSSKLCGFRKGYSSQLSLIVMLEEIRKKLDERNTSGILLTDLSKAFDCLVHDLLIAKLHAYGFEYKALSLINSYLLGRRQRTKIGTALSKWADIILGVPQGSILRPLLFNIYINDIFFFTEEINITNYADDNTPYMCDKSVVLVIDRLEKDSLILCQWFKHNYLKCNEDNCHLLLSNKSPDLCVNVGKETIYNSTQVKLLGNKLDNDLNFDEHVSGLCKKANSKFHALSRVSNYMGQDKLRLIMNAFITSQFGYCPLVWMFHSRWLNNRINKIHEKALRLVYNDNQSTFSELLIKDISMTIHERNLQSLAIEVYKSRNNLSPVIM